MGFDFLALSLLATCFGFVYCSKRYKLEKLNFIYVILAALCVGGYALVMMAEGATLLDTALGLTVLAFAVCLIDRNSGVGNAL